MQQPNGLAQRWVRYRESHPVTTDTTIRLLVLDIDGTLVGESNEIHPLVQRAIQAAQAKGIQVAIATGRMYQAALHFHDTVGSTLPLVSYQGALIQDPKTQEVHRHWPVDPALANQLLDYFEQPALLGRLGVHLYVDDRLYVRELNPSTIAYTERSRVTAKVGDLRQILRANQAPTKVLATGEDRHLLDTLFTSLQQNFKADDLYLTRSGETFVEATNPRVNKGFAVCYLAETLLGLDASQVMAIGDNFNDLEMLQYAGIGVAMGSAPEPVRAIADWVAPTVEEDGIVAAIERFIL